MKHLISLLRSAKHQIQSSPSYALVAVALVALSFSYYPNVHLFQAQISPALVSYFAIGMIVAWQLRLHLAWYIWLIASLLALSVVVFWDGLNSLLFAGMFAPALILTQVKISQKTINFMVAVAARLAVITSLLAVGQLLLNAAGLRAGLNTAYDDTVFGFARPRLFFEEPQFLAAFLLMGLAAVLHRESQHKFLAVQTVVLGIAITMSRGAAMAAVIGAAVYIGWRLYARGLDFVEARSLGVAASLGLLGAISFVSIAGYIGTDRQLQPSYFAETYVRNLAGLDTDRMTLVEARPRPLIGVNTGSRSTIRTTTQTSVDSRFSAASDGWQVATDDPLGLIFGHGPTGVEREFESLYGRPATTGRYVVNNLYIEILVNYGLIGLTVLLVWLAAVIYRLGGMYRSTSRHLDLVLITALVFAVVQQLFFSSIVNNLQFWLLLGLATSYIMSQPRRRKSSSPGQIS